MRPRLSVNVISVADTTDNRMDDDMAMNTLPGLDGPLTAPQRDLSAGEVWHYRGLAVTLLGPVQYHGNKGTPRVMCGWFSPATGKKHRTFLPVGDLS